MKLSNEHSEMIKKHIRRDKWKEDMVEVVSEFITFRIVSLQEAESLGMSEVEMEEMFDNVCIKLKETIDKGIEKEEPIVLSNLERLRAEMLLDNVEVNMVML